VEGRVRLNESIAAVSLPGDWSSAAAYAPDASVAVRDAGALVTAVATTPLRS
jgi:hypothetical protein